MSLNNGNGDVTANKNILLETPVAEKITAVKVSGEDAFWVIAHRWNSSDFITYKVTDTGINTTPIVSSVGSYLGGFSTNAIGAIKVSPDGTKLAIANLGLWEAQLFDFNNSTGVVSNPFTILEFDWESAPYGIEFSPNSNLLYVSVSIKGVYQFNLVGSQTDILNSETRIGPLDIYNRSLQLATDGKIYLAIFGGEHLDVINNPNTIGVGCNYITDGIFLDGNTSEGGLPPFIQSFFNVGFQVENTCVQSEVEFSANISQTFDTILWDFGDGTTSTDENPIHIYENAGDYEVSLSVTAGSESSTDTKTITVYDLPTVTPIVELRQCDDDLDGFSSFNLNEVKTEISANSENETITYHETELDAENRSNSILNFTDYLNETINSDSIWARIENNNGCYALSQVNLIVSTTQIPNTFSRAFYRCDDGVDTNDGISTFDFSSVNAEIETLFPVGQQIDISYYRDLADALSEINAIIDISNYQNIGYPNNQDIYIRVDSELNNDCLGLGHYITLHISPEIFVTEPIIIEECDEDGDEVVSFDTSNIETELTEGQTEPLTISYMDEFGNTYPSPLPNPLLSSIPILNIVATMTNDNGANSSGSCSVETTVSFMISSRVTANPVPAFNVCDTDGDGMYSFDTSSINTIILDGQTDVILSFSEEDGTALPNPLPNPYVISSKSIIARVENSTNPFCFEETIIDFKVNDFPVANAIANDFVCDDASNDGEHLFTLSDYNNQILGEQSDSFFEILYFSNEVDALNNSNPLSNNHPVNTQLISVFARIHNISETSCYDITEFQLGVNYFPVLQQPERIEICDDDTNDGFTEIEFNTFTDIILDGLDPSNFNVKYYLNEDDALQDNNQTPDNFTNTTNPQTFYVRLENTSLTECFTTLSVEILVNEKPVLEMNDLWPICEGSDVQIIADEGYDYYSWSTGETTRIITVDEPGQYTVTVSNVYGDLTCSTDKIIDVSISNIAVITDIETLDWSQTDNTISVFVEGNGDYEYSLDGITYQDENIFNGLEIDEYIIYVRDKNGCGIASQEVYLLNYPRYFTPNGDGDNDFWQIKNSAREPLNTLHIYNRYGKLITRLKPNDFGWDGTLNGSKLPSSDYWFILERQNGKTYTGHFTLKR